jgi:hypothetical protein
MPAYTIMSVLMDHCGEDEPAALNHPFGPPLRASKEATLTPNLLSDTGTRVA